MAEQPPKLKAAVAVTVTPTRSQGEPMPRLSARPVATPPPGSTPRASSDAIRTPSPAEVVKPSHTAHDRGIEVRMASDDARGVEPGGGVATGRADSRGMGSPCDRVGV